MNRKSKIIISITGIVIISLILIGLTYGYYMTKINGNTNDKSISINMANLELTYNDGNGLIEATNIIPGESTKTKTFTVKNTGDAKINNYVVYLDDVVNTFVDKNDLRLTLKCTSDVASCNGTIINYPSKNTILITNNIEKNETQSFELIVEFIETNDDQSDNMEKTLSGNIVIKDIKGTNNTLENITGTNNILIENGELLNNYKIFGNSTQNGTPTPDSPVEVESVGDLITDTTDINYGKYKIPIKVKTKNLIDINNIVKDKGLAWATGNYYNVTGGIASDFIKVKNNTNYVSKYSAQVILYDSNYNYISSINGTSSTKSFKITNENCEYIKIAFRVSDNPGITDFKNINDIMLEEGTSATEYEAYQEETYNIYLDEPLRKIDNYSDYIDFKSGKVVRSVKEYKFTGKESWNKGDYPLTGTYQYNTGKSQFTNIIANIKYTLNTHFVNTKSINGTALGEAYNMYPSTSLNLTTTDEFKTWLKNNDVKLNYAISTPIEAKISLPNINLNSTKNYINIDTTTSPSNIELEVIK